MNKHLKAILFMSLSALAFATMGAVTKFSSTKYAFPQIIFFRGIFSALFIVMTTRNLKINYLGSNPFSKKILFARSLLGTMGACCYFYAISKVILSDAVLLNNLSPIWVTIFAVFFLHEHSSKKDFTILGIMLFGAILIIKPAFSSKTIPLLIGFTSSIFAGAAYTLVRYLRTSETPENIVFWFSIYSSLFVVPLMLLTGFIAPTMKEFLILALVGFLSGFGQLMLTKAYALTAAGKVSIYQYLNVIFAGMYGYFFWKELPDMYSLLGTAIVLGAAYYSYKKNKENVI